MKNAYQHWLRHSKALTIIPADKRTHRLVNWQILAQPIFEASHKWDLLSEARCLTQASASEDVGDSRKPKGYWPTQWREDLKKSRINVITI